MKERMSLLNRMLLPLTPRLAYRREAWRLLARSAYTAEDASPRSAGWERTNRTGEATNQAGRDVIRARARDLERNSDVMEAILGAMERNVVGTGFVLQAKTEDESLNERIEASWRSWCSLRSCEITERWTLNELIALCVRRRMIDGGVLLLLAVQDGRLRLQLLEVDELDTSVTVCGKNRVYGGVEVDEYRRPTAYHIKVYDVWGAWLRTERYPAEGVIYLPYLTRPSQVREISPAAATLPRVDDLNELIDAAIEKERVLAHLSVAVEKEQGTLTGSPFYGRGLPGAESGEPKPEPVATELLQQGSITYLRPGEKVSTISQAGTSSVVSDTLRTTQRLAGSGLGLSYEAVAREILAVVDLLNEALPELGLAYDQYADSLNLSAEAIRGVAKAELARERSTKDYEQLKALLGEENTLYETLQANIEETTNRENELAAAQKKYNAFREEYESTPFSERDGDAYLATIREYGNEVAAASEALENAKQAESEAQAAYDENQQSIAELADSLAGYTEEMDESGRAVQDVISGITAQVEQLSTVYQMAYDTASESISGQYQLWEQAAEVAAIGAGEINAALESQTAYWSDYNANLENLAARGEAIAGLSEMIGSFADGSADSVSAVAGMASATDEELAAMVESWQKLQQEQDNAAAGIAELKTGFSQEMDELQAQLAEDVAAMELSEEAAESGRATIQGFVDGASGMLPRVQAAYRRIADAANAALNSAAASTTETGFASGTMSAPPGWAWVGEAGPELMRLRGGETILPAEVSQNFAQAQQELQAFAFVPELTALLAAQQAQNAVSAVEAQPSSAGGVTVSLSPSYQISGSANAEELQAVLAAHDEELVELILRTLEEAETDAARRAYR